MKHSNLQTMRKTTLLTKIINQILWISSSLVLLKVLFTKNDIALIDKSDEQIMFSVKIQRWFVMAMVCWVMVWASAKDSWENWSSKTSSSLVITLHYLMIDTFTLSFFGTNIEFLTQFFWIIVPLSMIKQSYSFQIVSKI